MQRRRRAAQRRFKTGRLAHVGLAGRRVAAMRRHSYGSTYTRLWTSLTTAVGQLTVLELAEHLGALEANVVTLEKSKRKRKSSTKRAQEREQNNRQEQ